ncbi:MAG: transcriptional activator RfaH [Pseudorhodoplanes sp.]|nr:transcriptional activator RfaH [Pseudorhodoplanes sp.]GIK79331.1 MAG: transcription antitermination protein RfaH [Alphaproteobacteria bacterium]
MTTWYAVYTQPQKEGQATEHLARQGFRVFFPRYLKRRSHARRVDTVPAPLFPRYLFVSLDAASAGLRAIRSTRGVVDLVRNGADPVAVPPEVISEIERRQDEQGFVVLARHLGLRRGAPILIDRGPFSKVEGIFEAMRDGERVVALLSLLGRKVVVNVPIGSVVPA